MFALMVTLQIKPGKREEFLEVMMDDATNSVALESGCLQFNVIQDQEDEHTLHLYEVYASKEAFETHRAMPHFARFAAAAEVLLAAPPVRVFGTHLFPSDAAWTKQTA
ncbi:putative quinol monooxygenase [Megalodesulfovibrio paquesii]